MMEFKHKSIMLEECMMGLAINPDGIYVDGTVGGAGHAGMLASRLNPEKARLICLDQDPDAVEIARQRLKEYPFAEVVNTNFSDIECVMKKLNIDKIDGILLDLGVSSFQLDTADRGFSYQKDALLDMRMSKQGLSAYDVVNEYEFKKIIQILRDYSEERFAYKIAQNIIKARQNGPINTTYELSEIIKSSMPAAARRDKNPCKRTFQAIRIEVNHELESLERGLDSAFSMLREHGRMAVITFHSLEDRIVKQRYREWSIGCTCPKDFPICICNKTPKARMIPNKPIEPSPEELNDNPRSRSARLRVLERLSY